MSKFAFFAISPTYAPLPSQTPIHVSCGSWERGGMDVTCFLSISHSLCLGPPVQHEVRENTCGVGREEGRLLRSAEAISGDLVLLCWAMIPLGYPLVVGVCVSFLLLPLLIITNVVVQNSNHLLSYSSVGQKSEVINWVLCLGSHKAEITLQPSNLKALGEDLL